jgi:hypothetical protein
MQDWTRKGKNKLVTDPTYRKFFSGPRSEEFRKKKSTELLSQYATGCRVAIRDSKTGQYVGSKMIQLKEVTT